MMRTQAIALALSLAACGGSAQPNDFRLIEIDRKTAKIVDFSEIETHNDGSRTVTLIGVAASPMPSLPGKAAQFVHFKYRFDCQGRRYRGEGVFAYDREFKLVNPIRKVSPWRPVDTAPALKGDFTLYCSADPAKTSIAERIPAKVWTEAADIVHRRLKSQRTT